jgi:Domain of unknown function (DUF4129)
MRSPWPVRVLLPAAQSLAEGSWLAVLYAALQAAGGELTYLGPIELGALALAGTAWGRRRQWTSATPQAVGLPLLALLAGLIGWLLSPGVRAALVDGNLLLALSLHMPGWLAALAFWRGEAHRFSEDDALIQDRLVGWGVPGLAVPWLIGYAASSGQLENDFAAAAFVSTFFFIGSAFTALGLSRLEAMRLSTGSDWRRNRAWVFMIVCLALALTALSVPTAALLGISASSLLATIVVPLQTLILIFVVLTAPIFILAALVADLLHTLLPGIRLDLSLPSLNVSGGSQAGSDLPAIILIVVVGCLMLLEIVVLVIVLAIVLWERLRRDDRADPVFEERSIVFPPSDPREHPSSPTPLSRRSPREADATGAYLAALDALEDDGRWARRRHESPAAHLIRARADGLLSPSFGRLAAAYQLVRYGPRPLPEREHNRALGRLRALRSWLQGSHKP